MKLLLLRAALPSSEAELRVIRARLQAAAVQYFELAVPLTTHGYGLRMAAYRFLERYAFGGRAGLRQVAGDLRGDAQLMVRIQAVRPDAIISTASIRDPQVLADAAGCPVFQLATGSSSDFDSEDLLKLSELVDGVFSPHLAVWGWLPGSSAPVQIVEATAAPISRISIRQNEEALWEIGPDLWWAALDMLGEQGLTRLLANANSGTEQTRSVSAFTFDLPRLLIAQYRHRREVRGTSKEWQIGIRRRTATAGYSDGEGYSWLEAPGTNWYADPFLSEADSRPTLFVEEFDSSLQRGVLSCLQFDASLRLLSAQRILERPYHLSYPQVIEADGEYFMIPESGFNETVELYRARSFPFEWEFVRVLQIGPYFDTTVHRADGLFWFFTTRIPDRNRLTTQLMLFSASRLDGDWTRHPLSPLTCSTRNARSAGSLFESNGTLIRPAQDCSQGYGGGVRFQSVNVLSDSQYEESFVAALSRPSGSNVVGAHAYTQSASFEAIDRLRVVPMTPGGIRR